MFSSIADPKDLSNVSFNCGNQYIDDYYKNKKIFSDDDAVTYCFWSDQTKSNLIGIASLSCSGIIIKSGGRFNITPAIEIKVFAVDERFQHIKHPDEDTTENWSDYCIYYLMEIIDNIRTLCGAAHVVLYSVPNAVSFYERHYFHRFAELMEQPSNLLIEDCVAMYLNL